LRAPLSFLPGVLGAAVLLAALVALTPVAAALFWLRVPTAGRRSLLPSAHVALLLAGFGSAIATVLSPLLAALVRVLALAAPPASLAPLSRHLRLVARSVLAPVPGVDLRRLVATGPLVAPIVALPAIVVPAAVALSSAVLSLALRAPAFPVVLVIFALGVTAVRTIFRTGIVVWHGTGTESARRENGQNRSARFSRETVGERSVGVEKAAIRGRAGRRRGTSDTPARGAASNPTLRDLDRPKSPAGGNGLLVTANVSCHMLLVRGSAGGTELTGTIYERGERAPQFKGAPDEDAAYVWVCDEFYEVESGGTTQQIDGEEVNVAFESPMPRGFDTREQATAAARDHVRTQFARIGVDADAVEIELTKTEPDARARTEPDAGA